MTETFKIVMWPDPEDGGYVVECPGLPGCLSQGETVEEALINIKEAMEGCLIVRYELGKSLKAKDSQAIRILLEENDDARVYEVTVEDAATLYKQEVEAAD